MHLILGADNGSIWVYGKERRLWGEPGQGSGKFPEGKNKSESMLVLVRMVRMVWMVRKLGAGD